MHRMTIHYQTPTDPDAFDRHYFEVHVPLCRPLPGLIGASFSKPRALGPGVAPYLVAQLDFADADAFRAALASPEMALVAQDADNLPAQRSMFTGDVTLG